MQFCKSIFLLAKKEMPSADFLCLVCVAIDCIVVLEQKHLCRVVSLSSGPLELFFWGGDLPHPSALFRAGLLKVKTKS